MLLLLGSTLISLFSLFSLVSLVSLVSHPLSFFLSFSHSHNCYPCHCNPPTHKLNNTTTYMLKDTICTTFEETFVLRMNNYRLLTGFLIHSKLYIYLLFVNSSSHPSLFSLRPRPLAQRGISPEMTLRPGQGGSSSLPPSPLASLSSPS